MKTFALSLMLVASIALAACSDTKNTAANNASAAGPAAGPAPAPAAMPDPTPEAKALWAEIGTAYKTWDAKTPEAENTGKKPHANWVRVFYNDTVKDAIGGEGDWPEGSILAKENYMLNEAGDGPGMLGAITVMKKTGGIWYWAKFKPDGTLHTMSMGGMPMKIAGTKKLKCIGCHETSQDRDYVVSKLQH